jgi:hypothetical protein
MVEKRLHTKSVSLAEANTALKVLLDNVKESRKELEENIGSNIRTLVMP